MLGGVGERALGLDSLQGSRPKSADAQGSQKSPRSKSYGGSRGNMESGLWRLREGSGERQRKKWGRLPRGPAALLKLRFHPIPSPSQ